MLAFYFVLLAILATGSEAVLNGEPATPHQFPYHVGLYYLELDEPMSEMKYYCGGTVITERWVLTSAKCVSYLPPTFVKAGKHIVDHKEDNEQVRFVFHHIIHPEYKPPNITFGKPISQNDIAMIKVNTPFVFNEYVAVAEIPWAEAHFEFGSLAGWGSTTVEPSSPNNPNVLYYNKDLKVMDSRNCAKVIKAVVPDYELSPLEVNNNQICSEVDDKRVGAGAGDSGSALVSEKNGIFVAIGIVTESYLSCGTVGLPSVYTRVGAYSGWINKVMENF